ncbi:MAG: hypothetical protein NTU91_13090 [Chloroflexi bacterium]|nr:hypothetical protein [Chloroflexota bacterium]
MSRIDYCPRKWMAGIRVGAGAATRHGLLFLLLVLPAAFVIFFPGRAGEAAAAGTPVLVDWEREGLGGGGTLAGATATSLTTTEIADALSRGLTLRSVVWGIGTLLDWAPFGPPLQSAWNTHLFQDSSETLITDDQFVWGPNVGDFDIAAFLDGRGSPLAAHADEIGLWAGYSSVNPQVLLAVLELRYGLVDHFSASADQESVESQIETTALELATAFYEHLYTWGARAEVGVADGTSPSLVLTDGTIVALDAATTSGTYALQQVLSESSDIATFQ